MAVKKQEPQKEFDNTNTGMLSKNHEKTEKNEKWPDYQGIVDVEGVKYWLAGWIKTSKGGKKLEVGEKFFSLVLTPADGKNTSTDNDIPF